MQVDTIEVVESVHEKEDQHDDIEIIEDTLAVTKIQKLTKD